MFRHCSKLNRAVYAKRDNDAHRNGYNTTMEQRLAGSLKEAGAVIPDVPDLTHNANRSMGVRPNDPNVPPKRSSETRHDEQWQNI